MIPDIGERLFTWLRGNQDAAALIMVLHSIAETWDDLVDRDKPVSDNKKHYAFYSALVTLPRNPFYRQHFETLNPLIEMSIFDWLTANEFERTGDLEKLHLAHGLRFSSLSLTTMCARIIGGVEWAGEVNTEFKALGESWAAYSKEHGVT